MRAIHVLRTPRGAEHVRLQPFETLTMVLSALEWQAHNGTIDLVTDSKGRAWINALGLTGIWSQIDTRIDEMDDLPLDEVVFWAAGKLFALRAQTAPCVIIDLDFIVWRTVDFTPYGTGVAAIHREDLNNGVYPPPSTLRLQPGYALPSGLDLTERPINGAFVYHGDTCFLHCYAQAAIDFMLHADTSDAGLPYMVFAEQRLLPMLAKQEHRPVYEISPLGSLFGSGQRMFTHIWGYKDVLRRDADARDAFCAKVRRRIAKEFPHMESVIGKLR